MRRWKSPEYSILNNMKGKMKAGYHKPKTQTLWTSYRIGSASGIPSFAFKIWPMRKLTSSLSESRVHSDTYNWKPSYLSQKPFWLHTLTTPIRNSGLQSTRKFFFVLRSWKSYAEIRNICFTCPVIKETCLLLLNKNLSTWMRFITPENFPALSLKRNTTLWRSRSAISHFA